MKASASLWSADLLHVGAALDRLSDVVDGFHIDVMDGQRVQDLLFGPDFVRAVRGGTESVVDVHLIVAEADRWLEPFAEAGADMLTVHPESCPDFWKTLDSVRSLGLQAGVAVALDLPMEDIWPLFDAVDRVLLMGTEIGIKGVGIDETVYERIREAAGRRGSSERPEVYVDGGIRRETVPLIARFGADGVIPGSLVFGEDDPVAAARWIQAQNQDGGP